MMCIGVPSDVVVVRLISPCRPPWARAPRKQFQVWSRTARLDDLIQFIWFAAVFALPSGEIVHLSATRRQCAGILAPDPKEDKFSYIPEVKANPSTVRSSILPDFMPDHVGFVLEPPRAKDLDAFWKKCIGDPKVKVRGLGY